MRQALRALTHGVYVLGVHHENRDDYLIVSLVTQCSIEPPRVALALSAAARVISSFRNACGGSLSILDASQLAAVRRYGAPGGVRHAPHPVARTSNHHPIPPEASFVLTLSINHEHPVGDHVLFVADVIDASASAPPDFKALTLVATGFPYAG